MALIRAKDLATRITVYLITNTDATSLVTEVNSEEVDNTPLENNS